VNTHTYIFGKKEATRILSVFRWDVRYDEASGIIQTQVLTCMSCFITRTCKVHFEAFPKTPGFCVYSRRKMDHEDTPRPSYDLVLAFTKLLTQRFLSMLSDSTYRHKGMLHVTAFL